ncbi:MAG: hypothetical protein Q9M08_03205 [Mariprofundus sp.]|nr:hypothetical protein [Mariprofundus sp.]
MRNFDINQMPPNQAVIDEKLNLRKKELSTFKRNTILVTLGELSLMALAYFAAYTLFDMEQYLALVIPVAIIGPTVALICITVVTSLRYKEIMDKIRAYLPPEDPNTLSKLQGRIDEVDTYLERLEEIGRDITRVEVRMLDRHCKTYG